MSAPFVPDGIRGVSGLYGITPEWDDTGRLLDAVALAVRGGMQALQLRRKLADPRALAVQARVLREACGAHGIAFIVNDDWQLALDVGADGVHLGRDDADEATVARLAGQGLQVGVSCYNELGRVEAALAAGASMVGLGAVYASETKPAAVHAPLVLLRQARRLCEAARPTGGMRASVVAIGGITPLNAAPVAAAGADALAVVNGLFGAADIEAAARALTNAMAPR